MLRDAILAQLDAEIEKLIEARALVAKANQIKLPKSLAGLVAAKKAVKPGKAAKSVKTAAQKTKRVLSPEARKRIVDAQHKRWAAQKKKK